MRSRNRAGHSLLWAGAVLLAVLVTSRVSGASYPDPHQGLEQRTDSRVCLECHDGGLAKQVWNSHPYDIDYEQSFLRMHGTLRVVTSLPAAIRLDAGRVSCASCHDLASTLPAKLSLPKARDTLCFACHDL